MMKRKLLIFLMLIALAATVASPVDVNAFAKKSEQHKHRKKQAGDDNGREPSKAESKKEARRLRKEQKQKEKQERRRQRQELRRSRRLKNAGPAKGTAASDEMAGPAENDYPLTRMKSRYRIDLLVPMYLDELVKGNAVTYKSKLPDKAEAGVGFYEGVQIAADSLTKAGFKIDIYVHDIASAKESPAMLIAEGKLDSTDIIIGDVQPRDIPLLAAYARKLQVNFVSTNALVEGALDNNAYFTMMQPSLRSHCEWISSSIAVKYPGANVTLLYRSTSRADEDAYKYITANKEVNFRKISCNNMPTKDILGILIDTTRPNVVVIPILDIDFADSLLSALSRDFPSTHFEVYGMPTWNGITRLRSDKAFTNLTVCVTEPFYLNASSSAAKYVWKVYRHDYGSKPVQAVYRGYETMFWYAHLLRQYGTIFNVKYEDNIHAPFTSFEMKPRMDKKGNIRFYENKHVFLTKYEGGMNKTE